MSKSNGAVLAECEEVLPINSENAEFKNYYELPSLRYSNIFMFIVTVDTLLSIALWVTGNLEFKSNDYIKKKSNFARNDIMLLIYFIRVI